MKQPKNVYVRAAKQTWQTDQSTSTEKTETPQVSTKERISYINKIPIDQELNTARSAYKDACAQTSAILDTIRLSGELDIKQVNDVVDDCVDSILRNDSALVWLTQIRTKDNYTAEHSLRVCIYAIALGRELGFRELELQNIGVCGLLHDVGKVRIPKELLQKQENLSAEEIEIMQQHPTYGKKLLISKSGVYPGAVDVAYCHHERLDGSGYPRGITAERIPYYAKIIGILDSYDSMISDKPYSKGITTLDACRHIYQCKDSLYDKTILGHFIHFIGIYAPGSLVEMNTGEVGIIIETNNEDGIKPKILLVLGSDKQEKNERVVDLKRGDITFTNTLYTIKKSLSNGAYGIQIEEYLDKGTIGLAVNQ
ncbi:HD-GYP domain-containing protein [sulfur-oxidizing endosymbiont of Gigantopelta aegis]|uniref:HD-GYP domain-containing protein n=1 Tax=sulfur-oxidizing endosymbiont of Gigantopelta aegis TaxID=2794934 RepID=UPI0018DDE031|nr:HD-GYP domain-containing protein [sulfur-oxidizing endosymbiont of Gigantopelta aegis]